MSRSKAVPRELVGNFARLTSFLTRNRKREPFARCLHQPFCQNFWVTNSAIALGNTLCGYKATPYSALSCFSLFRQLKAFIGVAKAAMEKKNPLFWEDCQNPFGQAGGESLPHSSNPAWQLAFWFPFRLLRHPLCYFCAPCAPRAPRSVVLTQPTLGDAISKFSEVARQRVLLWPFLCRWPETETGSPQRKWAMERAG